jgi:virulence-associated protein VagC
MKSFAIDKHGDTRGSIICGNIIIMRKQLFGKIGSIKPAPNRYKLKVFGGNLTIEEFRENTLRDEDVEPVEIDSEEVTSILIPIQQSTKKLSDIQNSTRSNDALRLKRNKPLKRNQNNLESALGLIIK